MGEYNDESQLMFYADLSEYNDKSQLMFYAEKDEHNDESQLIFCRNGRFKWWIIMYV